MKVYRGLIRKEEMFWGMNLLASLIFGAGMYLVVSSGDVLAAIIGRLFSGSGSAASKLFFGNVFTAVCVYGRDLIWGYALIFALGYWYRRSLSGLKTAFLIAGLFELAICLWRFFFSLQGLMGLQNCAAVLIGNMLAILVILIHEGDII